MPARFNQSYISKIKREVRRYQKERSKLIRSGVQGGTVPKRVTFRGLMRTYYSKREMNKALKEMSLFTATKATKTKSIRGKVYSLYEIAKFRLQLGRERKATERELSLMEGFDATSPLSHNQYIKRLEARQRELSKNWKDIIGTRAGAQVSDASMRAEQFYTNWVNALFQDAEKLGFPQEKMEAIIKKLNTLTPQQFERLYAEDPAINYIFSYYNMEVKGGGSMSEKNSLEAFNDLYNRIDRTIERYRNLQ